MRNYVEKLEETECDFVDYGKNEVKFNAFKKISRLEMVFTKAKQDTTICVYCVLILLVIRLIYHLIRIIWTLIHILFVCRMEEKND